MIKDKEMQQILTEYLAFLLEQKLLKQSMDYQNSYKLFSVNRVIN